MIAFSQVDTNKKTEPIKCLPISTFKLIAVDLLRGDSSIAELKLANSHIDELEQKVLLKDSIIGTMRQKEQNYITIIDAEDAKYKIIEEHNKKLEFQLKKEKLKNKFKNYIGGSVVLLLSAILITH